MKLALTSMNVKIGNVSKTDLALTGTTVGSKAAEMGGQMIKKFLYSCTQLISQSVKSICKSTYHDPQFTTHFSPTTVPPTAIASR